MLKVSQKFYIDEVELENLAHSSKTEFFSSSLKFYRSVKDKDASTLTPKQVQWLQKIVDILDQKNIKKVNQNIIRNSRIPKRKFSLFPKKTLNGWVWLFYYE